MDKLKCNKVFTPLALLGVNVLEDSPNILPIDQSFSIPSNINPQTGFPFTDIQLVMRANSLSERQRMMADIASNRPDYLDEKLTDEQCLDTVVSRSRQLPSELLDDAKENVEKSVSSHNKKVVEKQNQDMFDKFVKSTPSVESKTE